MKYIFVVLSIISFNIVFSQFKERFENIRLNYDGSAMYRYRIYENEFNNSYGYKTIIDTDLKDDYYTEEHFDFSEYIDTIKEADNKSSYTIELKLDKFNELKNKGSVAVWWNYVDNNNNCVLVMHFKRGSTILNTQSMISITTSRTLNGKTEHFGTYKFIDYNWTIEKTGAYSYNYLNYFDNTLLSISIDEKTMKSSVSIINGGSYKKEINNIPLINNKNREVVVSCGGTSVKIDNIKLKVFSSIKTTKPTIQNEVKIKNEIIATGSGFIISEKGYVITNHHVVENGLNFKVTIDGKKYTAKIVNEDKINDLALLKITDPMFTSIQVPPFTISSTTIGLGEKVFTLGFPQTLSQGTNIKLTDGIISSKTGYKDDPTCYQISVPIQSGNSGGPLFDMNGNLVGIVNAGILDANLVGYAVKSTYLLNFLDVVNELPSLNTINKLKGKTLPQLTESLTKYCCLIEVSN